MGELRWRWTVKIKTTSRIKLIYDKEWSSLKNKWNNMYVYIYGAMAYGTGTEGTCRWDWEASLLGGNHLALRLPRPPHVMSDIMLFTLRPLGDNHNFHPGQPILSDRWQDSFSKWMYSSFFSTVIFRRYRVVCSLSSTFCMCALTVHGE